MTTGIRIPNSGQTDKQRQLVVTGIQDSLRGIPFKTIESRKSKAKGKDYIHYSIEWTSDSDLKDIIGITKDLANYLHGGVIVLQLQIEGGFTSGEVEKIAQATPKPRDKGIEVAVQMNPCLSYTKMTTELPFTIEAQLLHDCIVWMVKAKAEKEQENRN